MRYTFDRCLVDTASREVRLDGTAMALSPKAFELPTLLIDASVSRMHARVVVGGAVARIEDLQSKNGTKLRGASLSKPAVLAAGDVVTFGSVEAQFLVEHETETASRTD